MNHALIAAFLEPFVPTPVPAPLLDSLAAYLDLLVRWNRRLNLTAVRQPEQIVTRHFGESLFAAAHLLPPQQANPRLAGGPELPSPGQAGAPLPRTVDVGSGAGFPGLPLKLYAPALRLTLIESQQKKATFLREVVRTLRLADVDVLAGRAETLIGYASAREGASESSAPPLRGRSGFPPELVTLRAVEHFEQVLPVAAALLAPAPPVQTVGLTPRLALLIGSAQAERARQLLPAFRWEPPLPVPQSSARILLVGSRR